MRWLNKHIVVIGFKHVGKSTIAKYLALKLQKKYIDLDKIIEFLYAAQYEQQLTCREIVQCKGEDFFRNLEHNVLREVIKTTPCVLAVGGGTPMRIENCNLLKSHCIIHIVAKPKEVFDRIMRKGQPAFFPANEDPWVTFNRLWEERARVYKELESFSIENCGAITLVVDKIIAQLDHC